MAGAVVGRTFGALIVALGLGLTAVMTPGPTAAQGELTGELPTDGGLAGVLWGGGPIDELATVAATRGCGVRSAWTFEGVARGYVLGAPSFVNAPFLTRFPGAILPADSILVLVCEAAGAGPPHDAHPAVADVVSPYTPEALVARGSEEFEPAVGVALLADDDLRTDVSGLLNFLSPADELCTLLMNSQLVLSSSGSHSLLAGARYCDSMGVGSDLTTAFGGASPLGTTWLAELWPGVTGALSEPGMLVRVYAGAVAVSGRSGEALVVPAGAQVVVDAAGVVGRLATFEPGSVELQLLGNRGTFADDRRVQASGAGVTAVDDATAVLRLSARDALAALTLRNVGNRSLQITSITSSDANQFLVTGSSDCTARVLIPGGECRIIVEAVGCSEGSGWLADIIVQHEGAPDPYTISASKPGTVC